MIRKKKKLANPTMIPSMISKTIYLTKIRLHLLQKPVIFLYFSGLKIALENSLTPDCNGVASNKK